MRVLWAKCFVMLLLIQVGFAQAWTAGGSLEKEMFHVHTAHVHAHDSSDHAVDLGEERDRSCQYQHHHAGCVAILANAQPSISSLSTVFVPFPSLLQHTDGCFCEIDRPKWMATT
jgi:hypothetical protein